MNRRLAWVAAIVSLPLSLFAASCLNLRPDDDGDGNAPPPTVDDPNGDPDDDGLTNAEEAALGTDPANPDTDGDSLDDAREVNELETDPTERDTDSDGLDDALEVELGTDPTRNQTRGSIEAIPCDELLAVDDLPERGDTGAYETSSASTLSKWRRNDTVMLSADGDRLVNLTRLQSIPVDFIGTVATATSLLNLAIDGSTVSLANATLWQVDAADRETVRTVWEITDDVYVLDPQGSGNTQTLVNATRCSIITATRVG